MQTRRQAQASGGPSSSSSAATTPQTRSQTRSQSQTRLSPAAVCGGGRGRGRGGGCTSSSSRPPKYMSKSVQTMLDGMKPEELQAVAKYIAVREAQQRLEANEDDSYPPTLSSTVSRLSVRYIDENVNMDGGSHNAIVEIGRTRLLLAWSTERWYDYARQHTRHDWTIRTWSSNHKYDSLTSSIIDTKGKEGELWFCAKHFNDHLEFEYGHDVYPPLTQWRQKQSQTQAKSSKERNNDNGKKVKEEETEPMEEDIEDAGKEEEEEEDDHVWLKDHALIVWLFKVFEGSRVDLLDECFEHE